MKKMRSLPWVTLLLLVATAARAVDLGEAFDKRRFSLNVRNGELREVISAIASRGRIEAHSESSVAGKISISLKNVTLSEALEQLAEENGLDYVIEKDRLVVRKVSEGTAGGFSRLPASALSAGNAGTTGVGGVREIPVKYAQATTLLTQLQPMIAKEDSVIVDQLSNSLIFQGSESGYVRLLEVVRALDRLPQQILIEAQIVETSRSFLQAFGFNWGLTGDPTFQTTTSRLAVVSNPPSPTSPTGALRYAITNNWGGVPLDVRLSAAESNGDAKVISRPKVVTLNNTPANIQSGISFNVKTLSTVTSGSTAATGGVSTLNAGLTLNVTPTVMGKDLVKLAIQINNSQPDESQIVDGIPGIVNNSANTSVIVSEGRTAVIAGLVKNNGGRAVASVPFFANIPILGALFRSTNVSDRNNELVIFITPQLVSPHDDLKPGT